MEQYHKLSHFSELNTTELDQIVGGGWWEDFLKRFSTDIKHVAPNSPKIG